LVRSIIRRVLFPGCTSSNRFVWWLSFERGSALEGKRRKKDMNEEGKERNEKIVEIITNTI
jgi:hypothetical protein